MVGDGQCEKSGGRKSPILSDQYPNQKRKKIVTSMAATVMAAGFVLIQSGCGEAVDADADADAKAAGEEQHEGGMTPEEKKASEEFSFEGQGGKAPSKK